MEVKGKLINKSKINFKIYDSFSGEQKELQVSSNIVETTVYYLYKELEDIDIIINIDEKFIDEEDIDDLDYYINKIRIRKFDICETYKTKPTKVNIPSCKTIIGLVEYKYIRLMIVADYKIALVKGNRCSDDFYIYDVKDGYIATTIDYGCLHTNDELPTKDDFKISINVDDFSVTKVSHNYVCHIMGKIYLLHLV